jgi:hypothetical protein
MRQVGVGAFVVLLALVGTALVAGSAKGGRSGYVQPHYFRVHLSGTEQISFSTPQGWGGTNQYSCALYTSGSEVFTFTINDLIAEYHSGRRLYDLDRVHNLGTMAPVTGTVHEHATFAPPPSGCPSVPPECDATTPLDKTGFGAVLGTPGTLGITFATNRSSPFGLVPKGFSFRCNRGRGGAWKWSLKVPFSSARLGAAHPASFSFSAQSHALKISDPDSLPPQSTGLLTLKTTFIRIGQGQYLKLRRG